MIGHYGANGLAGRKKEIGYIDFISIIILGHNLSVLIGQTKISNDMVFSFVQ